jgi:hypothetical protein
VTSLGDIMEKLCEVVSSDMVSGQFYYESVRAGIRMTIPNIEDGDATLAIDLPQSELESFAQEPTSNLRSTLLPSGSGYCVASYQAQVYKSFSLEMSSNAIALYGSRTAQSSNLFHIYYGQSGVASRSRARIRHVVQCLSSVFEFQCWPKRFQSSDMLRWLQLHRSMWQCKWHLGCHVSCFLSGPNL